MKKRRLLSIVLSLCMVLALMPQMVFAEETQDIVFDGNSGTINGVDVSLSADFTLQGEKTLTIENGKTLTIPSGKTLNIGENGVIVIAEGGTLVVQDGGTLTNNGRIYVDGTFTGTADNLYYPLSYTISQELLVECTPIVDGKYDYNDKTYGKAGSDVTFRGFPTLGENQVFKLVATTRDGKNTVATKSSFPSISMPFASTSIDLEMITDCIINLDCNGGNLNDEGFLGVDDSDSVYYLDNKTGPLPTDITRPGYIFGGWYDNEYFNGEAVVNKIMGQQFYCAKWIVDQKPVLTGLEKGKNYCEDVIFSISYDDNIKTVTANGETLTAGEDGSYTIEQGTGEVTLMFIDNDWHTAVMTLTVYNGHDFGAWKSNGNDTHTRICKNDGCGYSETKDCTGGKATCTSKAKCEYCGAEYGNLDSSNHSLENIHAKDATVTETGNIEYWQCKDCQKYFSDEEGTDEITLDDTVISKLEPVIIEGKGQSITAGEKKALSFTSNADFSDFDYVELDGETLNQEYYTVKEGSTIVTLNADYVATLPAGEHTIGIVSESGTATTTFTVAEKEATGTTDDSDKDSKSDDEDSAKTGDNTNIVLWLSLMLLSGAGITGMTAYTRRKRTNE